MSERLTEQQVEEYLNALTPEQRESVSSLINLVGSHAPDLISAIDTGKWFTGLITFTRPDGLFCFAVGPRTGGSTTFHMHPYYCLPELQQRHGAALKKYLSGKSCLRFRRYTDLPEASLIDIIESAKTLST